jgi:homogentisate 1,2-dioxygenase
MTETHELAVMCDTFHPLRLTTLARDLDDGKYWRSWYEDQSTGGKTPDNDPAGITSHF